MKTTLLLVGVPVILCGVEIAVADDLGIDRFNASLAASRARAGDVYVNGTVNVVVDPRALRDGRNEIATEGPAIRIDPRYAVRTVNVVSISPSPVTISRPGAAPRSVELLPVLLSRAYAESQAFRPLGAVVLSASQAVRPVEVRQYIDYAALRLLWK